MKQKLLAIKTQIIELVGSNVDEFNYGRLGIADKEVVQNLLSERCFILNRIFRPTETNLSQFKKINDELYRLSMALNERVKKMAAKKEMLLDSPDFDDDYELEGTLQFVFNDETSICSLPDDDYYGSDFPVMIKTLYGFLSAVLQGQSLKSTPVPIMAQVHTSNPAALTESG